MQYTTFSTFRFHYPLYSALAFSKRSSVIFLLVEIIQLIAVNADHKLQHIVDKGCQSCALIPQQMEYFWNFVLGFEADIYGSPSIGILYGTEKRLLEIGQQNLFSLESWSVRSFSGVGRYCPGCRSRRFGFWVNGLIGIVGSASSCFGPFCATSLAGNFCPQSISRNVFSSTSTPLLEECLNVFLSFWTDFPIMICAKYWMINRQLYLNCYWFHVLFQTKRH